MGIKTAGRFCKQCSANVLAQCQRPNHILHLLLTLLTAGLWVIVWIIVSARVEEYHCTRCGGLIGRETVAPPPPNHVKWEP